MFSKATLLALATASTAFAQSATITIEASHGGAGNGLTNTTITIPLNARISNPALQTVSTLYLTGSEGVDLASISCTPYTYNNGTGPAAFTSTQPSRLSTNTVQVGSLLCTASDSSSTTSSSTSGVTSTTSASGSLTPPTMANGTLVTVSSPVTPSTASVFVTTMTGPSGTSQSTVTSTAVLAATTAPGGTSSAGGAGSTTSSATPSLSSDNAGSKVLAGNGLIVAGLGLMAML
ncbi:hypothetical protein PRZ48_005749 [Zasmidium cellare]|uniref:GPI anchored protein n=1 Tax=Zasmidium cellare TaxID=395010 RepID=A0ABR0EL56_ZASCE|nr:hypothetical protein PRZ48_005749 [Zasmidium cellare]